MIFSNPARKIEKAHEQAVELYQQGNYPKVITILEKIEPEARKLREDQRQLLVMVLNTLAGAYSAVGNSRKAADVNYEAYTLAKDFMDESDYDYCGMVRNAARLCHLTDQNERAENLYEEALRLADKSVGPDSPEKAMVWIVRGEVEWEKGNAEAAKTLISQALKHILKDEYGDGLFNSTNAILQILDQQEEYTWGKEVCEKVLERFEKIYLLPYEPLMQGEAWVLNYGLARTAVLRKDYQEHRVEPNIMLKTRKLLTHFCMNAGDYDTAIENFEKMEAQINRTMKMKEAVAEESGKDTNIRAMLRADFEVDQNQPGHMGVFHIPRGDFYGSYGAALHFKAQSEGNMDIFKQALEKYETAERILSEEEEEDAEETRNILTANIEEVKNDMANITNR